MRIGGESGSVVEVFVAFPMVVDSEVVFDLLRRLPREFLDPWQLRGTTKYVRRQYLFVNTTPHMLPAEFVEPRLAEVVGESVITRLDRGPPPHRLL